MSRRTINAVAAIMLAALLISGAVPAHAASPRRVVVLLAPYLTWADVDSATMPNLTTLAQRSILANMNVRAGAVSGASTPDRGAIVLSAGASVEFAGGALNAFNASETVGATKANDLYRQYFGRAHGDTSVLFLGQPRHVLVNVQTQLDNRIGALGSAAHAAGARTAAIGCADLGYLVDASHASRPAGEAVADENGEVDLGNVAKPMLTQDPTAPYGVRANTAAILRTYRDVMSKDSSALVVVDPGDLYRATAIASSTTTEAAAAARTAALRTTDSVLGDLVAGLGPNDSIIVLAQALYSVPDMPAGYGPLILASPDGAGLGVAASTHRDGIVTEMDVSSTIVDLLGGTPPQVMIGSRIAPAATLRNGDVAQRIAYLDRLATTSVAVESVRGSTVNAFIIIAVIVLLGSALILYRGADALPTWLPGAARTTVLLVMCFQLAGVLQFIVWRWPATGAEVLWQLAAVAVACLLVVMLVGRGRSPVLPLVLVTGGTSLALLIDQWAGAPLSLAQIFGYSPLLGARYYGMGNEMAGMLLGSVMVTLAVLLDTWRDARWAKPLRVWGWPLVGAVVLVTAAAPFWGANVGTVAWMTVGFLTGWMLLNGRRVWTWRNAIIVIVIIVVVVAGLSVVDLLGAAGSETHLGRAISGVQSGGIGTLWTIIARKAETNVRVLGRTNWTWLLMAVLLLLGYMRWRPRGEFAALLREYPAFSAALAASLFAGTAGYFTEDSGIIIPALMFIPVGVTALYLMLSHPHKGGDAS